MYYVGLSKPIRRRGTGKSNKDFTLKVGFHYPSSRAVNSARELGPWTRVVETDL